MTHSTNTYQTTFELDNYLKDNGYFDEEEETIVNQKILALWDTKFQSAIIADIKSKYDNVEIDFVSSEFELESEDNRGAGLSFHKVVISDKINLESIKAFIKTIVNYNKTNIYLDSSYASTPWFVSHEPHPLFVFHLTKKSMRISISIAEKRDNHHQF